VARNGAVSAAEVARFPGFVQRAEGVGNVLWELRAGGGADGIWGSKGLDFGLAGVTERNPDIGITFLGLNRGAVFSGPRFREQRLQSHLSVLPPERRCEEKGMFSATKTHLAKELFQAPKLRTNAVPSN
jgi:hypothetical protein